MTISVRDVSFDELKENLGKYITSVATGNEIIRYNGVVMIQEEDWKILLKYIISDESSPLNQNLEVRFIGKEEKEERAKRRSVPNLRHNRKR